MKKQIRFDHPSNFLEVERKFQQKKLTKKLVKSQEQSQAGLMQLLRMYESNSSLKALQLARDQGSSNGFYFIHAV